MPYIGLLLLNYLSKMRGYTQFFFGFQQPLLNLLFPHSDKPHKNTSVLVGTVLNTLLQLHSNSLTSLVLEASGANLNAGKKILKCQPFLHKVN